MASLWATGAVHGAALPVAANVFILARQHDTYVDRISSAILLSTAVSDPGGRRSRAIAWRTVSPVVGLVPVDITCSVVPLHSRPRAQTAACRENGLFAALISDPIGSGEN